MAGGGARDFIGVAEPAPIRRLRIAVVTPRYEETVLGGAELHARWLAQRLADRGHDMEVLTTCAVDGQTWRNELPAGSTGDGNLLVRRFRAEPPRFGLRAELDRRLRWEVLVDLADEERWLRAGPNSRALEKHLARQGHSYDAVLALPYLAGTTYFSAQAVQQRFFLIPCLHDEPFARLQFTGRLLKQSRAVLFNSDPERALAERLFPGAIARAHVVGLGFDPPPPTDAQLFRRNYGVSEPFILYVGRLEPHKNVPLLIDHFLRYKSRRPGDLKLLLVGAGECEPPPSPHLRRIEIDWADRDAMLMAALLLVQPSTNESLSIVMMQAWACGRPVVVHAAGEVARYHCEQGNGGLWFANYPEFEAILDRLHHDSGLAHGLGKAGQTYVQERYSWERVLRRLEGALGDTGVSAP